jgi:hypothetical protein
MQSLFTATHGMTTKVNTNMGVKQNINMRARAGANSGVSALPMARGNNS